MNTNSAETVSSALPAQADWRDELGEYLARLFVVGFGIFVGWIAAYIIGVFAGWVPFSIC